MNLLNSAVRIVLLAAAGVVLSPVYAATTTYTVNSLVAGEADDNVGDGICQTATAGECSLRAALQEANALPVSVGDDIRIEFAPSLNGDIVHNGATPRMLADTLGNTTINDYLGFGAFLHVNAQRPVTIDFGNRIGAVQVTDNEFAMLYIESDDVVVENFRNDVAAATPAGSGGGGYNEMAGITGGASAIVIGGSRVTVRNGLTQDPATVAMESCISLIDGASDVLIEDYYCRSSALFGIYFDERGIYSNITLNRYETEDGRAFGDVWAEFGESGDAGIKTTINGLTVTDSEFRSSGIDASISFRRDTVVNNLSIVGSRFLGVNTPGIITIPSAQLGTVLIEDNVSTATGSFFGTDVDVAHTGILTIRNNVLTGNLSDAIFLQSPTSGTVIENNQFLNQRSEGNVAGVRIATGASGTNNVIRNNLFSQAEPINRFAIWMRACPSGCGVGGPGGGGSTGWSVANNAVTNIFGSAFGPIYNDGDGDTLFSGNTFGEGTRGAVIGDPAPENDDSFFLVNADQFSNNKIQTWRPNGAVYTGSTIRVAVAPVAEPRAGNTEPTAPVSIDVYYTATDKAETYLGRIPGTHSSETVFEFTSNATSGAVRAQITDALGRSSQYSAAQEIVQGLDGGADDDMDGLPNGAECLINLLGIPLSCRDTDGDGTPDYLDTDDDNDGIPTRVECPNGSPCVDTDGDGTPNNQDLDSDADGISDMNECPEQICRDTDGDGAANYVDVDSDGDGLDDATECPGGGVPCQDVDGNGTEDYLEPPAPIDVRTTGGSLGHGLLMLLGGLALLRRRALPLLAGLLGLAAVASPVHAADDEGWMSRFYGGAKAGALFTDFDEADLTRTLQAEGFDVEASSDDSDALGYGLWLGYALNSYLGLELSYTAGADERVRYEGPVVADLQGLLDAASPHLEGYGDTYLMRLRYHHVLNDRWFLSPHIGVGTTQTRQTVTNGDRSARLKEDSFTWAVGGGLHYALTRDWSVGVGADYYQGSSDNAYGLISGIVEWRFPRALPEKSRQVPALEPVPVRVVPVSASAAGPALALVLFALDSDVLTDESREQLDRVLPELRKTLQRDVTLQIEVAGHTDASGSEAHNASLSQARAQAVESYLVSQGIERERLGVIGYGLSQPRASNDTEEGRSQNRRVELRAVSR